MLPMLLRHAAAAAAVAAATLKASAFAMIRRAIRCCRRYASAYAIRYHAASAMLRYFMLHVAAYAFELLRYAIPLLTPTLPDATLFRFSPFRR